MLFFWMLLLPRNYFWQFMDRSDLFSFLGLSRCCEEFIFFPVFFLFVELVAWYSLFSEACCEVAILLISLSLSIFPRKIPFWCQIRRFAVPTQKSVLFKV